MDEKMDQEREISRREFFNKTAAAVISGVGVLFSAREALAKRVAKILCGERIQKKSLMKSACEADIKDPNEKFEFLESCRSTPTFEQFAEILPNAINLSQRKLTCLYPGSGSHIAPLALAARLIDNNKIDSAEFIYTEIDPNCRLNLQKYLKYLTETDKRFYLMDPISDKKCNKTGTETAYTVFYMGKPITIRLLLNCSAADWFRPTDFEQADVFISHDPSDSDSFAPEYLLFQYLNAMQAQAKFPRAIIMEDLTQALDTEFTRLPPKREFDLELIGKVFHGKYPYGHRDGTEEAESTGSEIGNPQFKSGALIVPYPLLKRIDPELLLLIMEISLVANNIDESYEYRGELKENRNETNDTEKQNFYSRLLHRIAEKGINIPITLAQIDIRLAQAAAFRILQTVLALRKRVKPENIAVEDKKRLEKCVDLARMYASERKLPMDRKKLGKIGDEIFANI